MSAATALHAPTPPTESRPLGDGVPVWMAELGVKKSEWLSLSKAQLRTMQAPTKPLKVRLWATGMLHSPGYRGEEAFRMRNNKKFPLAPTDIIEELFRVAKQLP